MDRAESEQNCSLQTTAAVRLSQGMTTAKLITCGYGILQTIAFSGAAILGRSIGRVLSMRTDRARGPAFGPRRCSRKGWRP